MDTAIVENTGAVREVTPHERRLSTRIGVMWMATLRSATGFHSCMVIDISQGGARLKLATQVTLLGVVTLVIDGHGSFRAEPVWQRTDVAGVRFLDAPERIASAFAGILPA